MSNRRIYTFGLVAALLVSCVWAALAQNNRDTPVGRATDGKDAALRDLARLVAVHEVHKLHWTKLEASREFTQVIDQLSSDLLPEELKYRWKVNVFSARMLNEPGAALDDFDRQAVAAILAGQDEAWQARGEGAVRFATAIRARTSCIPCHQGKADADGIKALKPNDIIGIVALKMYPGDEMAAPDELRAAIENLRSVARKYRDTKAAERVLELLKQLEKKQ